MDLETETFVIDEQNAAPVTMVGALSSGAAHRNRGFSVANSLRGADGHHGHSSPRGDGADNLIAAVADPITAHEGKTYTHEGKNNFRTHNVVGNALGVRRLTPLECERLMGWADGWTALTADGRTVPDAQRYRMCGNGVIGTVAEWLGWRLRAVDALR